VSELAGWRGHICRSLSIDHKPTDMLNFVFTGLLLFSILIPSTYGQLKTTIKDKEQQMVGSMMGKTVVASKNSNDTAEVLEQAYPRVARKFFLLFPEAINASWVKETGFLYVSFVNHGNKSTASFSPKGTMNYCISYIAESDFPADLHQKIKGTYPADEIFSIKEIMTEQVTLHEIVLQNSEYFIVVSLSASGISEVKKIKKS
jgi:hypothetical protein